jgi:hypothetical protein
MTPTRLFALSAGFTVLSVSAGLGACGNGDSGARGDPGAAGPAGMPGPAGPAGAAGTAAGGAAGFDAGNPALSGACTTPCHTFGGVVDQWRFSGHSHPQENEIGGGVCGNCHGIDGIQQRLANNYMTSADAGTPTDVPKGHIGYKSANGAASEISYGGASAIGRIHCSTCHDFNPSTDPHVTGKYLAGQAPLRVPGGVADTAFLEKTEGPSPTAPMGQSVAYRAANTCVFCHKSRKDVSSYVTAANTLSSRNWGPHEGPQADVFSGKGGYQFAGVSYGSSTHVTLANACVSCHMGPVAGNSNVPDHTMKPTVAFCKTCHTQYNGATFDIQGGQTIVRNALTELQLALNAASLLTRSATAPYAPLSQDELDDHQFHLDKVRPGGGPGGANIVASAATAGAIYNYLMIARGKDMGVHNPTYAKQLLWDSIKQIKGTDSTSLPSRPQ